MSTARDSSAAISSKSSTRALSPSAQAGPAVQAGEASQNPALPDIGISVAKGVAGDPIFVNKGAVGFHGSGTVDSPLVLNDSDTYSDEESDESE